MSTTEKHQFKAEIEQLLDIVIHSLYTDKEIFVRELISNAADALEKLRFQQASGLAIYQPDLPLSLAITTNDKDRTIIFTDTGVGMNQVELVENLGTIAHSGSKAFLSQLAENQKSEAKLIGQFGVGFYSAFMVASKVEVFSRSCRPEESGWRWISEGPGGFSIEPVDDLPRGTRIVVHLKEEQKDFAQSYQVEQIIQRYSNFVPYKIELNGKELNTVKAIWSRNKNEIKDEEYNEFYHYLGHDQENPLCRLHFSADAPLAIQALLFVPSQNIEALGLMRTESEVHLYCKKVLISAKPKGLLPEWLRFLKGVVDSEDLPLNISRETMQDSGLMQKLNQILTGRFIKLLEEQAEKDAAAFDKFYEVHGRYLKEGLISDFNHHPTLARLLRYETSALPAGQKTSLMDYVKRMPADPKEIYYQLAPNREAAENSPYYEVFRSRQIEVLFFTDPWDEFVMEHLHEFESKSVRSAEKTELKLGPDQTSGNVLNAEESKALAQWMKSVLGDRIEEVRVSERLVESPAVMVDKDKFLTSTMRHFLKTVRREGKSDPAFKHDLEINPRHGVILRLEKIRAVDAELAEKVAEQIYDNARVAAGLLEDPRSMVKRLNELLEKLMTPKP